MNFQNLSVASSIMLKLMQLVQIFFDMKFIKTESLDECCFQYFINISDIFHFDLCSHSNFFIASVDRFFKCFL